MNDPLDLTTSFSVLASGSLIERERPSRKEDKSDGDARSWPAWPVLCFEEFKACMKGPQMLFLRRVLAPAFLIIGMAATAAWTLLLGYGLFALVEVL